MAHEQVSITIRETEVRMDEDMEGMEIVWGEEFVPLEAVDSLVEGGMSPDEAIPYALLLTRLTRRMAEGKGMPAEDVVIVRSLLEHLVDSLLDRTQDEYDEAVADMAEAVTKSIQPSQN